jgi:2-polyprenyl-6-methoxyphenol hydroxylase-like FAD-dependent oxidoreductase
MQHVNIAVIGGGPAGLLAAAAHAQAGARVTVYERQPVEQQDAPEFGWPITLQGLAYASIERAGLSSDFGARCRCAGYAAMSAQRTKATHGRHASQTAGWRDCVACVGPRHRGTMVRGPRQDRA